MLRSSSRAARTVIRKAYAPLFDADQQAYKLSGERLKSLVAQVAGTDADLTGRITGTFSALTKLGDFETPQDAQEVKQDAPEAEAETKAPERPPVKGLRTEFHYNIQIQLPSNGSEETYLNIFNAIRQTFQ